VCAEGIVTATPSILRCAFVLFSALYCALLCGTCPAVAAEGAATGYRFKPQAADSTRIISAELLTPEERSFIAALPVVRVGVALPGNPPYELIGRDGEISGIHPEMLGALASAFGIRIEPVVFPDWASTLAAAREKKVDVLMSVGVSSERLAFLAYTLGATPSPAALFGKKGAGTMELSQARFAIERDYLAADYLRRQYPDARIVTVDNTIAALRTVAQGEADFYLGSLLVAIAKLAETPVDGVEALRLLNYATGHYHFAVRKDWEKLATILNRGIQTLRSNPSGDLAVALAGLPAPLRPTPVLAVAPQDSNALLQKPVWRLGAVRGLAMLNDIDAQQVHSGIAAEYAQQIARRLGIGLQVLPFDNVAAMLDAMRRGEIDLVPFLSRTAAREREFSFSAPYIEMPYMLVARSDGPLYWGLASLRGKRLALAREHPMRELLRERYPQVQIVDVANGNDAMDRVARGDADAAVEVKLFANLRINSDNDGRLRATAVIDELPARFHFAAAATSAALIPLVNQALADIPNDERARMLQRWVALDLQPGFPWQRYLPMLLLAGGALVVVVGLTAWWARRLQGEVRQRRRSETLLNDIATQMPGVAFRYVLEPSGAIKHNYFSPSAAALLGIELDRKKTVLASIAARLSPSDLAQASAAQKASLSTLAPCEITVAYQHPDGHTMWLHALATHSLSSKGRNVWTGFVVDVSSERQLQAKLAREAQARNLLLATASHELRAPTHNLSLALQAIHGEALSAEQAGALRIANKAAQTLTQLLNDVLDAAHFDSGAMQLRPCSFALAELVEELRETWAAAASAKGLVLQLECAPALPTTLVNDPLRLKQVLTNLLSNACKYTERGHIGLRVALDANDPTRLCFQVSDTGPGIDTASQQRLFKPFATLERQGGAELREGSSGLGLLICRHIAELMGGEIVLSSDVGRGSVFTLRVPLTLALSANAAAASAGDGPAAAPAVSAAERKTGRIVVCDDDPTSRMLTAQMLRLRGFRVVEAPDGNTALACCEEGGVAALVTDLDMPGMPGRELIRRLREAEQGGAPRTAVIVCSGSPVPPQNLREQALLHDAYLLKPVQLETLVTTLGELGVVA
jgi:two-component system, NarL family, sensor histidine kinase EvgS